MSRFRFVLLSLFSDAVLANAGLILAFFIRFQGQLPNYNFHAYVVMVPIITLLFLFAGWVFGLYEPEHIDTPWGVTASTFEAVTLATILVAVAAFLGGTATTAFPRWTFPFSWIFNLIFFIGWRLLFLRFGSIYWPDQRTLIVGTSNLARELARSLNERSKWGWKFIGFVEPPESTAQGNTANTLGRTSLEKEEGGGLSQKDASVVSGASNSYVLAVGSEAYPVVGAAEQIEELLQRYDINRLIISDPALLRSFIVPVILDTKRRLIVDVVPELYEIFIGRTDAIIGDIPLMRLASQEIPRYQRVAKRILDLIFSSLLLIITSPLMLIATLASLIVEGRPVIYCQDRVGKKGKVFSIIKLRTMCHDAEKLSGPVLATEDDPRVTRVGRILRKFRIDELPQLVNVFKGDMSFIGPRPERPSFVTQYLVEIPGYRERFRVKPGVTGLAQVNGGYATTPERKLKYDLMYLYHQDLMMDLQIIVETFKVVLTGRGAR